MFSAERQAAWLEDIHGIFEAPHDNPPKRALLITAYLDESQQESLTGHVVVAGFCGTEDQWKKFVTAWQKEVGEKSALHMKQLRWNHRYAEKRVRDKLARLAPIPYECGLLPAIGAAKVSDYIDLIEKESEMDKKIKGYTLCLAAIFALFMERYPGHEKIAFVCEAQEKYEPLADGLLKAFRTAGGPQHPYLVSVKYVRKNETPLTQPSDFLAFAIGKHLDEYGSKKDVWCRPIHINVPVPVSVRPGFILTRKASRETILEIQSECEKNARVRRNFLTNLLKLNREPVG